MVKVDLTLGELRLISYLAGLASGELAESEEGARVLNEKVFPLLDKLGGATKGVKGRERK